MFYIRLEESNRCVYAVDPCLMLALHTPLSTTKVCVKHTAKWSP